MAIRREVIEGPQLQGVDERLAYTLTTTPWGSAPTGVVVLVTDMTDGTASATDVTATVMPANSPLVSGDVITLSLLRDLTLGRLYRVDVRFAVGGNTFEPFFYVRAQQ